jgi:hypothetical protein
MPASVPKPVRWPCWMTVLTLAWAVLLGATGCGILTDTRGPNLTSAELVGGWTESERQGTLTFLEGGQFRTDDAVPLLLACGSEPCVPPGVGTGKLPASGTWRIGPALADPHGPNDYVYVTIDHINYPGVEQRVAIYNLRVEQDKDHFIVLNPYHRFPDNKPILYRKT